MSTQTVRDSRVASKSRVPASRKLGEAAQLALDGWRKAKLAESKAKDARKLYEAQLRGVLDGALVGTVNGTPVIKVSKRTRTGIDTALLREIAPEVAELTKTETEYEVLLPV